MWRPSWAGKRLQLLREAVPGIASVGLLVFGRDPLDRAFVDSTREAAALLGVQLHLAEVPTAGDIDSALATLRAAGVGGVIVPGNLPAAPARTAALAAQHRLPSIAGSATTQPRGD